MKRWLVIMLSVVGLCLSGGAETAAFTRVKVLKDNCNLRAKALVTSEVVGQAAANDILIAKTMNKEWVEVVPPTNIDLWILGDYVKDGLINCSQKVNVRAGAGINFNIVGQLSQGEKVEVRGTHAEWIKIAPPPACSLWISRLLVSEVPLTYVEPAKVEQPKAEPVGKAATEANIEHRTKEIYSANNEHPNDIDTVPAPEAGKPMPAKTPASVLAPVPAKTQTPTQTTELAAVVLPPPKPEPEGKPSIPAPKPAEQVAPVPEKASPPPPTQPGVFTMPPGLDLVPNKEQGRWREVEGILRPKAFFFRVLSDFRLVSCEERDKNSVTICYVKGNHAQLEALMFRHLVISGREYWVKGQKYPVIVPERIVMK